MFVVVHFVDKPSAPRAPLRYSDLTESTVNIEWKKSELDGGTPIKQYVIEIRESRRSTWGRCGAVDAETTRYTAKNLVVDNEYYFRIRAVNTEGESPPLESEEGVIPKKIIGKEFYFL